MDADARCIRVKHFISEESNNTYSVYVKEKVVITVVQSLEYSLYLSESSSMKSKNKSNSDWVSICCATKINWFSRALGRTWCRASSLNVK